MKRAREVIEEATGYGRGSEELAELEADLEQARQAEPDYDARQLRFYRAALERVQRIETRLAEHEQKLEAIGAGLRQLRSGRRNDG